jgi:hypothetical protein
VARAYGSSIIMMMSFPFVLLALVAFLAVRSARKSIGAARESE